MNELQQVIYEDIQKEYPIDNVFYKPMVTIHFLANGLIYVVSLRQTIITVHRSQTMYRAEISYDIYQGIEDIDQAIQKISRHYHMLEEEIKRIENSK